MGGSTTTIISNIGSKFVNIFSSICFGITFIGILLLVFYKEIFDKAKINKKIIPKIIVAFLCLLAGIILILISSNMVFNIGRVENALFWLVAVAMLSVSILVIVKQYLIDKKDWEEKPISAYLTLIGCMLYAILFAFIVKPDLLFKVFFTIHTVASLIAFVNTVFRYGIKAKNIWQMSLFVLSVIALMALMIYSLYMWFWSTNTDLFTSIMGVFAGLLGGIITLGGVAWTIKRQDEIRKEDERKRVEPIFAPIYNFNIRENYASHVFEIILDQEDYGTIINKVFIENSDNSNFVINGFWYNKWYYPKGNTFVLKNKLVGFYFYSKKDLYEWKNPNNCYLKINDCYGKEYLYKLNFIYNTSQDCNVVRAIEKINKEEAPDDNN